MFYRTVPHCFGFLFFSGRKCTISMGRRCPQWGDSAFNDLHDLQWGSHSGFKGSVLALALGMTSRQLSKNAPGARDWEGQLICISQGLCGQQETAKPLKTNKQYQTVYIYIVDMDGYGGFQKWDTPIAGWFIVENPIEMDALGVPAISGNALLYRLNHIKSN